MRMLTDPGPVSETVYTESFSDPVNHPSHCTCGHDRRREILDKLLGQEGLEDHHVGGILHVLDYMPYNVGKAVESLFEAGDYPAAKYKQAIAYLLRELAVIDG